MRFRSFAVLILIAVNIQSPVCFCVSWFIRLEFDLLQTSGLGFSGLVRFAVIKKHFKVNCPSFLDRRLGQTC